MEYGKCVRHPILGECGKLQEPKSCASCNKLITSKDFLTKWEKLKNSQLNIIDQLEIKFKEENIKKRLFEILSDTPLPDRTMVKSNHMIIMDNGKSYRKTDYANTEFKELLKGILGKDYEDYIEKSEK